MSAQGRFGRALASTSQNSNHPTVPSSATGGRQTDGYFASQAPAVRTGSQLSYDGVRRLRRKLLVVTKSPEEFSWKPLATYPKKSKAPCNCGAGLAKTDQERTIGSCETQRILADSCKLLGIEHCVTFRGMEARSSRASLFNT